MKKNIIIAFIALWSFQVSSQNIDAFFEKADVFFKINVTNGRVNYDAIHQNPKKLRELLTLAEAVSVSKVNSDTYRAFWINAYNLAVIKGVVDNFPTKSPLDNAGFFDKTTYKLGGKSITLNDIEHKLLRAEFNDARFHFVLVCGAMGCPPLISNAYLPQTIDMQLDQQTKLALNGTYFIKVNSRKKRIEGSEIMKWYKEDFTMEGTKEIDFINKYRREKIPSNYKLIYFPYNWNLNKQ